MKLIKAFIQPHKLKDVKDALKEKNIMKMTVSSVRGAGSQGGYSESYRGVVHEVNLLRKTVIEVIVNDDFVSGTIDALIKGARTGNIGDGKIIVQNIEEVIRIRTGEKGKEAVG